MTAEEGLEPGSTQRSFVTPAIEIAFQLAATETASRVESHGPLLIQSSMEFEGVVDALRPRGVVFMVPREMAVNPR